MLKDTTTFDSEFFDVILTHGIYPAYRPDIWLQACRKVHPITYDLQTYPTFTEYYTQSILKSINLSLDTIRQIELDLPRTFCEQKDFLAALEFKANQPQGNWDGSRSQAATAAAYATELMTNGSLCIPGTGDIHDALRRILRTFCINHPDTGYLQSMNFLAAFFLLVFGREREADAYECFETLVLYILPGYYSPGMIPLQIDTTIANQLINQRLPKLATHFERLGLSDITALFLPRWMLCVYLNCFPADITVRIWDIVILESINNNRGPTVLIETALAILRVCQQDILNCSSFADAVEVLKTLGPRVTDAAELMHLTRHAECSLVSQSINEWRNQYGGSLWFSYTPSVVPSSSTLATKEEINPELPVTNTNVTSSTPAAVDAQESLSMSTFFSPTANKLDASFSSSQGTRTPPVNIDNTLERIFSPLPPSPLHSPSFRSPTNTSYFTSPTVPSYPTTNLLLSPTNNNNNTITSPSDILRKRAIKASTAKRLSMVNDTIITSPTTNNNNSLSIKVPSSSSTTTTLTSPTNNNNVLTSPKTIRKNPVNNALKSPLSPKGVNTSLRSPLGVSSINNNITSNKNNTNLDSAVKPNKSNVIVDKSSIAAALNATVAAASQRKQQRENTFSASMAAVANGFAFAAAAVMKSTLTNIPSSSSVTEQATAAASRFAKAFISTKAHPTAYTEYDHEANDCELEAIITSMSPKVNTTSTTTIVTEGIENELSTYNKKSIPSSVQKINNNNYDTPFSPRNNTNTMNTATFASPNGRMTNRKTGQKTSNNYMEPHTPQAVQMMMLSPPRINTMRV